MNDLRSLPSVDKLLSDEAIVQIQTEYGRPQTLITIREVLDTIRQEYAETKKIPAQHEIIEKVNQSLSIKIRSSLIPVINATGTILHTNLGRAPLSQESMLAMQNVSAGYNNLEFDISKGKRGSRSVHAEALLVQLTGAEAATVVNNNAGAVLLTLSALASRKKVAIARSQLIEIGGGFRIPDVMKQSGAKLLEVGTTNRVHLTDYEKAITEESAKLVMRAHHSNYKIVGFTHEPQFSEIIELAHAHQVPVIDDLGSGTFVNTSQFGLSHEPTIQESVLSGADIITFSGDKLLGGPQAGIIIGKSVLIQKIKKHPLARALRPDKLCLAGLSATLIHYLKDEHLEKIPVWQMISTPPERLKSRVESWVNMLQQGEVKPNLSTIGGGSMPGETLPSFVLSLTLPKPDSFLRKLRGLNPPIIARVENDEIIFDPRTILPEQERLFLENLHTLLS